MKKLFVILFAAVLALGAFAGCSSKSEPEASQEPESATETIEHHFDYEGIVCDATVDVSGGWDADFGNAAIYLFNEKKTDDSEAVAHAYVIDREEYDLQVADLKEYYDVDEVGGAFIGKDEDGNVRYLTFVNDEVYLLIQIDHSVDYNEVISRINVH